MNLPFFSYNFKLWKVLLVQDVFFLLTHEWHEWMTNIFTSLQNWLTDLEIFAALIAAMIHDFAHTGTTNNFHVMSEWVHRRSEHQYWILNIDATLMSIEAIFYHFMYLCIALLPSYHPWISWILNTELYFVICRTDTALIYNDRAVLENFHISSAFKVIRSEGCNILSHLNREQYR